MPFSIFFLVKRAVLSVLPWRYVGHILGGLRLRVATTEFAAHDLDALAACLRVFGLALSRASGQFNFLSFHAPKPMAKSRHCCIILPV